MPLQPLDGPSAHNVLSVGTATPVVARAGGSALTSRKAITLQGDGKFYVYFGDEDASAPSAATVVAQGFLQFKDQVQTWEVGDRQPVYLVSDSGTTNVRIAERA